MIHMTWVALGAAIACALCNGVAAVLQKTDADKQAAAHSLDAGLLWRLLHGWRYSLGVGLDLLAGGLILVATHYLPLFLVQAILASNIAVTLLIERFVLGRPTRRLAYAALALVVLGLALVGAEAAPAPAHPASTALRWTVALAPVALALAGGAVSRLRGGASAVWLGVLSGISFGGTAIVGRMLVFPSSWWHVLFQPLPYAFALFGLLGITLFTTGLQRTSATALNTIMVTAETLVPAAVGVVLLGDTVRHGVWIAVVAGLGCTLLGAGIMGVIAPAERAS